MSGFSFLMFIFGICVLLVGLYMFTGHEFSLVSWRAPFKNLKEDEWKNIGKWTMLSSVFIFIIAIIVLILGI